MTTAGERDVGALMDASFAVWRAHWKAFALLGALGAPPAYVFALAAEPLLERAPATVTMRELAAIIVVGDAWYTIVDAATVVAARDAHAGAPVSAPAAMQRAVFVCPRVLAATVLKAALIIVPALIAVGAPVLALRPVALIAGVPLALWLVSYASCRLFAIPATVLFESRGVAAAVRSALALTRGRAWHVALSLAPVGIIYLIATFALNLLLTLAIPSERVAVAASVAVHALLLPTVTVVSTLLYLDLRDVSAPPVVR